MENKGMETVSMSAREKSEIKLIEKINSAFNLEQNTLPERFYKAHELRAARTDLSAMIKALENKEAK